MKVLLSIAKWTGALSLVALQALYFQCPTSVPADPPTRTPTPPTVTPTTQPARGALPSYSTQQFAELSQICPGKTGGVSLRTPPNWHVAPRGDGKGFYTQTPDGRSGMSFTPTRADNTASDTAGFPWANNGLQQKLAQRGIAAQSTQPAQVTIFDQEWPAYFWWGKYTPPATEAGHSAPRLLARSSDYQPQADEEQTGLITVIPYGEEWLLEIVAFAPTEEWEEQGAYFAAVLASMEEPPPDWSAPSMDADATAGWSAMSSISSSGPGYAVRYPSDWNRPEHLTSGYGFQASSADGQTAVIVRLQRGGNPATLLAGWQAPFLTAPTIEEGEPVTLLGSEVPTRIARGQDSTGSDVTASAAVAQQGEYVAEVVWYTPSGEGWDSAQETLTNILGSLLVLKTETLSSYSLMVSYPASWSRAAAPAGEGLWARDADSSTGLIIWVREGGDPAAMLADWDGSSLTASGEFSALTAQESESVFLLSGPQNTKNWQGQDASGVATQGSVAFAAHNNSTLEVVWYAPAAQWDQAQRNIFFNLHTMIRPSP